MSPAASDKPSAGFFSHTWPGFSLVEVLLVIGLLAIVMAGTLPFFGNFLHSERTSSVTQDLLDTVRRAQHRALIREDGQTWGVRMLSGSFVLYGGSSYETRLVDMDEMHSITPEYMFSGLSDVHFSARGVPQTSGFITIDHPGIGTQTLEINSAGGIFLQSS